MREVGSDPVGMKDLSESEKKVSTRPPARLCLCLCPCPSLVCANERGTQSGTAGDDDCSVLMAFFASVYLSLVPSSCPRGSRVPPPQHPRSSSQALSTRRCAAARRQTTCRSPPQASASVLNSHTPAQPGTAPCANASAASWAGGGIAQVRVVRSTFSPCVLLTVWSCDSCGVRVSRPAAAHAAPQALAVVPTTSAGVPARCAPITAHPSGRYGWL